MKYRVDMSRVLGIVCAGGDGTRIDPLSRGLAKPAIQIGGNNRLLDIMLSNLLNSIVTHIYVLVQRHAHTLNQVLEGYHSGVAQMRGQFLRTLPPPKVEPRFYESDMDSLIQNIRILRDFDSEIVVVVMADQVVKCDFRDVLTVLNDENAEAIMVYKSVPVEEARGQLGVLSINGNRRVKSMMEKPLEPAEAPDSPGRCYANLAMYAIRTPVFFEMLEHVAANYPPHSVMSKSGIPWLIKRGGVRAFNLVESLVPGAAPEEVGYFADTGTVKAWFDAQMAMCQIKPVFNFYSREWPIFSTPVWPMSPTKADDIRAKRTLFGFNVILQENVAFTDCVISTGSQIGHDSELTETITLFGSEVGPNCRLNRVVLDEGVVVPEGMVLSADDPPPHTVSWEALYRKMKGGELLSPEEENAPVLSAGHILVFPKPGRRRYCS